MPETAAPYVTESTNADHPPDRYSVPWRCPNGHIMGQIIVPNGFIALQLFRFAVLQGQEPQRVATISDFADNVVCSICGATRTWIASEAGIKQLLERRAMREAEKL